MKASTTSQSARRSSGWGWVTLARAREASLRAAAGVVSRTRRDRRELEAEAVVEHEGDPLARGEPVEHDVQGETDGVGERDVVGWVV